MNDESGEHQIPTLEVQELELKMEFINMKEFMEYIRTYAILKKFVWEYVKNNCNRTRLKCHDPDCNWFCYVKQKKNGATIVVKTLKGEHTCVGDPKGGN